MSYLLIWLVPAIGVYAWRRHPHISKPPPKRDAAAGALLWPLLVVWACCKPPSRG